MIAEIHPEHFTAEQLEEGIREMYRGFYCLAVHPPAPSRTEVQGLDCLLVHEHLPEKDGPPGRFPDQLRRRIARKTPILIYILDFCDIRPYRREERQKAP